MSTNKITENLSWTSLEKNYPVVNIKGKEINMLKDAIEDGTLMAEIKACADQMYGGDTYEVLRVLSKNMSSALVNIRKRPDTPSKRKALTRCELLREFISGQMKAKRDARPVGEKPFWTYTADEINSIPLTEIKVLKSIRDCMASRKAKYPDKIEDLEAFTVNYKAACTRYAEANKASKSEATTVVVDDNVAALVTKLKDGKSLSKADKAKLAEVLGKLI